MKFSRLPATLLILSTIPLTGWAGVKKPTSDPNTPEGKLLDLIEREADPSKRLNLLELFPELFLSSTALPYVWSEMQARYHQAGKFDQALQAGASLLNVSPNDLETACLNWRIAVDAKDPVQTTKWITRSSQIAERVLKNPDPAMSKAAIECGQNARQMVEYEAYKTAFTAKNPADRIKMLEEYSKAYPQNSHAGDIEVAVFLAYREMGDSAKALAAAEKLVAHNDTREDAMLLLAEASFKAGKDPDRVLSLSRKAIDRLNNIDKPENISAADWARNKTAELTQANYMIGVINFQAERWDIADQAFRAALPNLTDPRYKAEVLSSLGWANYKMRKVAEAIKFYVDCTTIPGPYQLAAGKTLSTITAEYKVQTTR